MTPSEQALAVIRDFRDAAPWQALAKAWPDGTSTAPESDKLLSTVVNTIHRALPNPFALAIARDFTGPTHLVVCPSASRTILIPVRVTENVTQIGDTPIFTARAHGRESIKLAVLNLVTAAIEQRE